MPSEVLKEGTRGDSVPQLQKASTAVHFHPNRNAKTRDVDGIFGTSTENTLRFFQIVYVFYQMDGVCGPC